jgi:hypothetical protein
MPRLPKLVGVLLCLSTAATSPAGAQNAGPLALLLPVSARPAALGNAWVAGRDEYAIFSNPAIITPTPFVGLTVGSFGGNGRTLASTYAVNVGPANFAWGVQIADFSVPRSDPTYPYAPSAMNGRGDADNFSMVALVGGRIVHKGFQIGVSGKYAQDIAPREASTTSLLVVPTRGSSLLLDIGTAHALWTGVAGLALQNIAEPYSMGGQVVEVPTQLALGWTKTRTLGPLDFGFAGQATLRRHGWVGVGGGIDLGWSWIEGYTVGGRIGARRTETDDERPVAIGATFNADRLNLEYSLGFFAGDKQAHRLTVRWR